MTPKLSVVIATFNRLPLLVDLARDLAQQTISSETFEVIVVDDGSAVPVRERLEGLELPYPLTVVRQANAGAAAARHRGVEEAKGEIIVFIDDDMHVEPSFLASHLEEHMRSPRVVQGYIAPPADFRSLPLFERFHAFQIERFVRDVARGRATLRGIHLCTGNLSLPRSLYHEVGGFDLALMRSEDRELGVRLEKAGARLVLSTRARSVHRSDHDSLQAWLRRSFNYGVYDLRIARKHPDAEIADPWRFWFLVSPLSRPLLGAAVLAPEAAVGLSHAVMSAALGVDRLGLERLAIAGTTVCYGIEYFRGLRREAGSLRAALRDL